MDSQATTKSVKITSLETFYVYGNWTTVWEKVSVTINLLYKST